MKSSVRWLSALLLGGALVGSFAAVEDKDSLPRLRIGPNWNTSKR